jgi:predicted HAD superfamily Cof-like phosphohydrolase
MKTAFEQVVEFHHAYDVATPDAAILLPPDIQILRERLINEELNEYHDAVRNGDIVEIADALADLAYVVIGTAVAHGLTQFDKIFTEVHRANMSKLGEDGRPIIREDGKVLKGPNYTPPNLTPLI